MWQGLLGRRPDWGIGPPLSTGVRKGSRSGHTRRRPYQDSSVPRAQRRMGLSSRSQPYALATRSWISVITDVPLSPLVMITTP